MYSEFTHDINTQDPAFNAWAQHLDAWLDTPDGGAWLDAQADAHAMDSAAMRYGTRPGLEIHHEHR